LLGIDEIKEMVVAECGYQDDADTARFCAEVLEDFVRDHGFCVISTNFFAPPEQAHAGASGAI